MSMGESVVPPYRILVTGSRRWTDEGRLCRALGKLIGTRPRDQILVIHGACETGADAIVEAWCQRNGIATDPHPAAWRRPDGKRDNSAGPKRNSVMVAGGANIGLSAWDGSVEGSGTFDCMRKMVKAGIHVVVVPMAVAA